eukprot:TRINITY_DN2131_c0_g1_i4.p1 TRINITY_DN2131_c0_g1~~TRINITY_DN2131_c0_g1_i4.p1  ORF type:complete len:276 (-),score=85.66 TRINITY_DN2131_c0_g1_i4:177-1004(-)
MNADVAMDVVPFLILPIHFLHITNVTVPFLFQSLLTSNIIGIRSPSFLLIFKKKMSEETTPEKVLAFKEPCSEFLCPLSANVYGFEFLQFSIRDADSGEVIFEISGIPEEQEEEAGKEAGDEEGTETKLDFSKLTLEEEEALRTVIYDFPASLLDLKAVGTTLTFRVGPQPVNNFRMIERHYFRDKLVKSFDFKFGFCIPNSTNTWEAIYDVPSITPEMRAEMLERPYETMSDSFYFVDDKLIMHNMAKYAYFEDDGEDEEEDEEEIEDEMEGKV